jgi:cell wall-associated NlpC family hydrolase
VSPRRRRSAAKATIAAAALIVALPHIPASAQPADDPPDPMERYQQLGAQAAQTEEDLSQAQENLAAKRKERGDANTALTRATHALTKAQRAENRFRDEIDTLPTSMYRNGHIVRWSAIFTSNSTQNFLDQMSALDLLATDNAETLDRLAGVRSRADAARADATQARQRAQKATTAAKTAVDTLKDRKADLDSQIQQVRDALGELSPELRAELGTVQDNGVYLGPPGAANDALQAALGRRGSPYEWGATGPNEFDCSGLTSWSYARAGITIPRTSRQQWTAGKAVSLDALTPGDLLFYDDGTGNPSAIHHVGMYVGDGRMVDAPTEGQVVDVRSMDGDGHLIGARRIVG